MKFAVNFQGILAVILMSASVDLLCHADEPGLFRGDGRDGNTATNVVNGIKPADGHGAEHGSVGVIKPRFSDSGTGSSLLDFDRGLQKLDGRVDATPEMRTAWRRGAIGKITLRVIDDTGSPVPNADVKGGFYVCDDKGVAFETGTDQHGYAAIEGNCAYDMNCRIDKQGFYRTRFVYRFSKPGYDCVKEGRWLPWNPVVEIILKRIVNPVAMHVQWSSQNNYFPAQGVLYGYDMEAGDWVKPFGKGVIADFHASHERRTGAKPLDITTSLTLRFTNALDGAYCMKADASGSAMKTVMRADTNALYQKEFVFTYERTPGKARKSTYPTVDDYFVLRTRTQVDEHGAIKRAHYAKIVGKCEVAKNDRFEWFYYFNPNANDPNLEADTTKNLLNPGDLGFAP